VPAFADYNDAPMASHQSLFEQFRGAQADLAELHSLLLKRFSGAMQPRLDELVYPGNANKYSVKVRFGDSGIVDILAGPNLTATEIDSLADQIASELVASSGTRTASAILFAHLPVEGWYRHGDFLQILPPPKGAPLPACLMADHPFLLQFSFPTSSNWAIRNLRRATRGRQISLLLTGLLAGTVRSLTGCEHHWTLLSEASGTALRTEYLQEGYVCPGFVEESDKFEPADEVPPLHEVEPTDYYSRWGISSDSRFEVPKNLSALLSGFYALAAEQREQFLRACSWFEVAQKFYIASRSAAFAALISSVEALMPPVNSGPECKRCGRPTGKSITQRFVEFLDQMAPSSGEIEKARKNLYRVRSALLHAGRLLPSDYLGFTPGPGLGDEFKNMNHAQRLVRLVLANWLGRQAELVKN
jgi:hypothetical protein